VGALLDDEHLGLDGSLDATGGPDLEAPAAVDVAFVIAVHDHVVGLDRATHLRLRADDQRPLALDLALRLALDPQISVGHVLAVEARVRINDALVAALVAAELAW